MRNKFQRARRHYTKYVKFTLFGTNYKQSFTELKEKIAARGKAVDGASSPLELSSPTSLSVEFDSPERTASPEPISTPPSEPQAFPDPFGLSSPTPVGSSVPAAPIDFFDFTAGFTPAVHADPAPISFDFNFALTPTPTAAVVDSESFSPLTPTDLVLPHTPSQDLGFFSTPLVPSPHNTTSTTASTDIDFLPPPAPLPVTSTLNKPEEDEWAELAAPSEGGNINEDEWDTIAVASLPVEIQPTLPDASLPTLKDTLVSDWPTPLSPAPTTEPVPTLDNPFDPSTVASDTTVIPTTLTPHSQEISLSDIPLTPQTASTEREQSENTLGFAETSIAADWTTPVTHEPAQIQSAEKEPGDDEFDEWDDTPATGAEIGDWETAPDAWNPTPLATGGAPAEFFPEVIPSSTQEAPEVPSSAENTANSVDNIVNELVTKIPTDFGFFWQSLVV